MRWTSAESLSATTLSFSAMRARSSESLSATTLSLSAMRARSSAPLAATRRAGDPQAARATARGLRQSRAGAGAAAAATARTFFCRGGEQRAASRGEEARTREPARLLGSSRTCGGGKPRATPRRPRSLQQFLRGAPPRRARRRLGEALSEDAGNYTRAPETNFLVGTVFSSRLGALCTGTFETGEWMFAVDLEFCWASAAASRRSSGRSSAPRS